MSPLIGFVRESNRIEGITEEPTSLEVRAHEVLVGLDSIKISDLISFVAAVAPGAVIRAEAGLDVRVGSHIPIPGGPKVLHKLNDLLDRVANDSLSPFEAHCEYETLHPFTDGNGRSGRALWLWMMNGRAPLGFLHKFYYQTLDASPKRSP